MGKRIRIRIRKPGVKRIRPKAPRGPVLAGLTVLDALREGIAFEPVGPLSRPTVYGPGSREKIGILAARVRAGYELFHPEDAGFTGAIDEVPEWDGVTDGDFGSGSDGLWD